MFARKLLFASLASSAASIEASSSTFFCSRMVMSSNEASTPCVSPSPPTGEQLTTNVRIPPGVCSRSITLDCARSSAIDRAQG